MPTKAWLRPNYGDDRGPFGTLNNNGWVGRSLNADTGWELIGSDDFEWRFSQGCASGMDGRIEEGECVGWRGLEDGALMEVPFSLWNTGPTSDPADDYRMLPMICESACIEDDDHVDGVFDIGGDHSISGSDNDPFSDWVYWYNPPDNGALPGEQGYLDFFWGPGDPEPGERVFARQVLVNWNGGRPDEKPYEAEMPEPGSIIQYHALKQLQPGDTFTFNTEGYGTTPISDSLRSARASQINVVPNPYLLASAYEKQYYQEEVRFSNLPVEEAVTFNVFTLHGQLIRTLVKPSGTNRLSWDLKTDAGIPIASGLYLIHVDAGGLGTHIIKFAAILKKVTIDLD